MRKFLAITVAAGALLFSGSEINTASAQCYGGYYGGGGYYRSSGYYGGGFRHYRHRDFGHYRRPVYRNSYRYRPYRSHRGFRGCY